MGFRDFIKSFGIPSGGLVRTSVAKSETEKLLQKEIEDALFEANSRPSEPLQELETRINNALAYQTYVTVPKIPGYPEVVTWNSHHLEGVDLGDQLVIQGTQYVITGKQSDQITLTPSLPNGKPSTKKNPSLGSFLSNHQIQAGAITTTRLNAGMTDEEIDALLGVVDDVTPMPRHEPLDDSDIDAELNQGHFGFKDERGL